MAGEQVFLDTSALFAAVLSATGGARQLFKLGEAGVITLWVGPTVLAEMDAVLTRKSSGSKGALALLLDRAKVQIGPAPAPAMQAQAQAVVTYPPDADVATASVVAEALSAQVNYLVSLDRQHLVDSPRNTTLPFPIGTPGDCLAWLRARWPSRNV